MKAEIGKRTLFSSKGKIVKGGSCFITGKKVDNPILTLIIGGQILEVEVA